MTDVLAIDGSADKSTDIMKFMYSIKWTGIYDTVTFIPLRINDAFTVHDMLRAIDAQNLHHNGEYCKSFVVYNHDEIQTMADGNNISFLDWALQCEVRGVRVFRNVYANDDNYVKFVYSKDSHKAVRTILSNLYDTVERKFSVETADVLFKSKSAFRKSLNIKEAEVEFMQATAASLRSNPKSTEYTIQYRPRGPRIVPSFGPAKTLSDITYSQATQKQEMTKQPLVDDSRIKHLEEKIKILEKPVDNFDESVKQAANKMMTGELQQVYDLIEK